MRIRIASILLTVARARHHRGGGGHRHRGQLLGSLSLPTVEHRRSQDRGAGRRPYLRTVRLQNAQRVRRVLDDRAVRRRQRPVPARAATLVRLRKEKYSCLGSQQIRWDTSGTRGTAGGSVDTRGRFVIECNGDCRGLRYVPGTQAQIYHFDRTRPVPVMQMKGLWFRHRDQVDLHAPTRRQAPGGLSRCGERAEAGDEVNRL